jgi:hypothetical protein
MVDDLTADHGPFPSASPPAIVFVRILKKYCVPGERLYTVKDVALGGIFAESNVGL